MTSKQPSYSDLHDQLDSLLQELQSPDIAIDDAIALYQKAETIIAQLEEQLKTAEVTIKKLKPTK